MITTFSKFYYGIEITFDNCKLDFNEGAGELTATLELGTYTPTEIAQEVEDQLNATGLLTYTVAFNRSTRILTITASSSMTLLKNTGTNAADSAYATLGFTTASNATGTSFVAPNVCCSVYSPQYVLQSYVAVEDMIEQLHCTVNETVTGVQELITYGDMRMMKCNITFITDIAQPSDGPILNNASGLSDARTFLRWIAKKNKIEFMPDKNTVSTFLNLVIDSAATSKEGTTMYLKEMYSKGLVGYFETDTLTFREIA